MNALSIKDLNVTISSSHILRGVSFEVPDGKVTALLGRNGVGKSTTLRAIMGLYPSTGSIDLYGKDLQSMETYKRVQQGFGFVPEDREIFSLLSVKENLALAERDSAPDYQTIYSLFPELKIRTNQRAGTLSGGQQQMVAIARSLINKNRILLVDEPTKGLAPKLVTEVADALAKVASTATMLLVEQNIALVKRIAENIVIMDQGVVVFTGAPDNLADEKFIQRYLGVGGVH
ncbi:MAG: ABC transporter ATP-binding protein [Actinomycetota bacterium]